jgi:hypothetical protein
MTNENTPLFRIRYGTNWEEKLKPEERGEKKDGDNTISVVYLRGLQRLGQEAGLRESSSQFNFIPSSQAGQFGIMQCIYNMIFEDGTKWTGAADCNPNNTSGKFFDFPTAVAESRAEARCIRKALGIATLSSEEVGFADTGIKQIEASSSKAIDSAVIKAIEKLCETRNISQAELLEAVLDKERGGSIFALTELTSREGNAAMAWLNEQKPTPTKKQTAAEAREQRKQELLAQQKKD